ncbi:hypothetical protein FRC07_014455, partial [Ceratobasidium sp. 392]
MSDIQYQQNTFESDIGEDNDGKDEEMGDDGEQEGYWEEGGNEGEGDEAGATDDDNDSVVEPEDDPRDSDAESYNDPVHVPEFDDPIPNPCPPSSQSNHSNQSRIQGNLRVEVDQHGQQVYIKEYPIPTVGEPVRLATPEDLRRAEYPD